MTQRISIIDYGMGNVHSVLGAVKYLGYEAIITNDHNEILSSTKIILPGVGEFRSALINLERLNLCELIKDIYRSKKIKILGICLGAPPRLGRDKFEVLKSLSRSKPPL